MKVVLVTGAGASKDLGAFPDEPLPLLSDWARRLRERLGAHLAEMTGLNDAKTGPEFEEILGSLFRWDETLELTNRFAPMTRPSPVADQEWDSQTRQAVRHARSNIDRLNRHLHESLFDEFGPERVANEAARDAYRALLSRFTGSGDELPEYLICATTNYDRSLEIAFGEMGVEARAGARGHGYLVPQLDTLGLGVFQSNSPSVIYLHGAVGWYEDEKGFITARPANEGFNETLGSPAVLYPDPNKELDRAETRALWENFHLALQEATHVLIVGHSLNDGHLVQIINQTVESPAKLGFLAHANDDLKISDEKREHINQALPNTTIIPGVFGPKPRVDEGAWKQWMSR